MPLPRVRRFAAVLMLAGHVCGQEPQFFYPLPPAADIVVTKAVSYGPAQMELLLPRRSGGGNSAFKAVQASSPITFT